MTQIVPEDPSQSTGDKESPPPSPIQRRPNRRLKTNPTKSSLDTLSSSLGSSLDSSVTTNLTSSTATLSTSMNSSLTRSFSSSLRDRRGLASTNGSLKISFTQNCGLDQASMREILSGFSDDDSQDEDDDDSVDSYLNELRKKQVIKDAKGRVKFSEDKRCTLAVIDSDRSLREFDGDL